MTSGEWQNLIGKAQWRSSGGGNGQFNTPLGISVDQFNNPYVTDNANNRAQKFAPN